MSNEQCADNPVIPPIGGTFIQPISPSRRHLPYLFDWLSPRIFLKVHSTRSLARSPFASHNETSALSLKASHPTPPHPVSHFPASVSQCARQAKRVSHIDRIVSAAINQQLAQGLRCHTIPLERYRGLPSQKASGAINFLKTAHKAQSAGKAHRRTDPVVLLHEKPMERRGPRSSTATGGGAFATVTPAFIDTTELSRTSDDADSNSSRGESPVTIEDHPILEDVDMSFRASQSFSHSQRGGGSKLTASTLSERLTMMNIPMQELKGTVYYGWLWKKGSSFKTWKKRFFLLHGRALTYYPQCCVIASDSLGTQCLDMPAKGGLRVRGVELSNETQYGLKVTSSSGRVLHIQAGDQDARMQWLEVLEEAPKKKFMESMLRGTTVSEYPLSSSRSNAPIDFTSTSSSTASSQDLASFQSGSLSTMSSSEGEEDFSASDKRGWLQLRTGVLHSWKKRYVTLADGNITITTNKRSKRPEDKAFAVIACTPFGGHKHAFCVRLDRNKELYMAAASESEAEAWIEAFKNCL